MSTIIIIFLAALSLTALSIPHVRKLALFLGFVDRPSARKMHEEPMPLMGGVGIFLGAIVAFFLFLIEFNFTARVQGVLLASSVMAIIGLADDRRGLPAYIKFLGQIAAALVLISFDVRVKLEIPEVLNYGLTIFWIVGISNAVNFLDNMDGLCAGICGVSASFIVLMAAMNGQYLVAAMAAAVFGACAGFLRYNFKPAQIFMGDAGSLFLGFILAVLAMLLKFPDNASFVTWMVPIVVLGLPIFDVSLVFISRIRRGVNPFTTAGKDHTSHRLVAAGHTQKEAVLMLYLLSGVFGMIAMFITHATVAEGYALGATVAVLGICGIWHLERSSEQRMQEKPVDFEVKQVAKQLKQG